MNSFGHFEIELWLMEHEAYAHLLSASPKMIHNCEESDLRFCNRSMLFYSLNPF